MTRGKPSLRGLAVQRRTRRNHLGKSILTAIQLGTVTVGKIEEDGSMTLDLRVGPTTYAGAADSIDSLADDLDALVDVATT